jgi:hypothetical protein
MRDEYPKHNKDARLAVDADAFVDVGLQRAMACFGI